MPRLLGRFQSAATIVALTPLLLLVSISAQAADADLTATEILTLASARLAQTKTVHFDLDIDGETFIDDAKTIQLLEAEGDLARPDRVATAFRARLLGAATVTIELITIGDESWTTNLLTGNWEIAPAEFGYDPSILFDDQNGLGPVMGKVTDVERQDDDKVDDREAYHVKAIVEQEIIDDLTAGTMKGSPVAVELWIDRETNDLLRAKLAEPSTEDIKHPATWTLTISDHDRDVTIETPETN